LGREFRRGVEIAPVACAADLHRIGLERMQMRLVARRDDQRAAFDLGEALPLEPRTRGGLDASARDQRGTAVGVHVPVPPVWHFGVHGGILARLRAGWGKMSTFVLVHGAWHGGWCWYRIAARLEAAGHTVFAPDMPGHGTDRASIQNVTMDSIVAKIGGVIDA